MTSEDQEANSKPAVAAILPSSACGCFLRTSLYTLFGCQLAMLHMKLILKFSSISIVWYPANLLTILFHHSTDVFIKSLLFVNYHVRPWGTKTEQGIEEPCPCCSMYWEKTWQTTRKEWDCVASSMLRQSSDYQAHNSAGCAQRWWSQTCTKSSFLRHQTKYDKCWDIIKVVLFLTDKMELRRVKWEKTAL